MARMSSFCSAALGASIMLAPTYLLAADPWLACPENEGRALQVSSCYSTGSGGVTGCPTGQRLALDEAISFVESRWPTGTACSQSGYTVGALQVVDHSNAVSITKPCTNTSGQPGVASPGLYGAKVCDAGAACQRQIGDQLPAAATVSSPGAGELYCLNHCQVRLNGFGLVIGASQSPMFLEVTAKHCEIATTPPAEAVAHQWCWTANGKNLCVQNGVAGVFIDGELLTRNAQGQLCLGSNCVTESSPVATSATGAQIARAETNTPPAPDTGTEGDLASPDTTVTNTIGSGAGTYNYWSPSTVAGSTTRTGTGGDGDDSGSGGDCGGAGLQPCAVKIDETGMPSGNVDYLEHDAPWDEIESTFSDLAASDPVGSLASDLFAPARIPSSGASCQTVSGSANLGIFGVRTFSFPDQAQCEWLQSLKAMLGWFLASVTSVLIGLMVMHQTRPA